MIEIKQAYKLAIKFAKENKEEIKYLTRCDEIEDRYVFSFSLGADNNSADDGCNIEVYKENGNVDYHDFLDIENMKKRINGKKISPNFFKGV